MRYIAIAILAVTLSGCGLTLGPVTKTEYVALTSQNPVTIVEDKRVKAATIQYDDKGNVKPGDVNVGTVSTKGKIIMDAEHFAGLRKWAQKGYDAEQAAKNGGK